MLDGIEELESTPPLVRRRRLAVGKDLRRGRDRASLAVCARGHAADTRRLSGGGGARVPPRRRLHGGTGCDEPDSRLVFAGGTLLQLDGVAEWRGTAPLRPIAPRSLVDQPRRMGCAVGCRDRNPLLRRAPRGHRGRDPPRAHRSDAEDSGRSRGGRRRRPGGATCLARAGTASVPRVLLDWGHSARSPVRGDGEAASDTRTGVALGRGRRLCTQLARPLVARGPRACHRRARGSAADDWAGKRRSVARARGGIGDAPPTAPGRDRRASRRTRRLRHRAKRARCLASARDRRQRRSRRSSSGVDRYRCDRCAVYRVAGGRRAR